MRLGCAFHEWRNFETDDALMRLEGSFKNSLFALRSANDHRQQHAVVVLCQALLLQGKSTRDGTSADVDKQAFPFLRERLNFQLDH